MKILSKSIFQRLSVQIFLFNLAFVFLSKAISLTNNEQQRYLSKKFPSSSDYCYALIFEANSINTKLKGFKWNCKQPYSVPSITAIDLCDRKGDRLNYLEPAVNHQSIEQLRLQFSQIFKELEDNFKAKPLVFLKATGDLRAENSEKLTNILSELRLLIKDQEDYILLDDSWVGLLSEEEEDGLLSEEEEDRFLWLSANYANGGFFNSSDNANNSVNLIEINQKYEKIIQDTGRIKDQGSTNSSTGVESTGKGILTKILVSHQRFDYGTASILELMIDLLGQITEKAYCFRRIDAVENKYLYNSTSGIDLEFKGDFNGTECVAQILGLIDLGSLEKIKQGTDVVIIGSTIRILAQFFLKSNISLDKKINVQQFRQIIIENCQRPLIINNTNSTHYFKDETCLFGLYISALLIEGRNASTNTLHLSGEINNIPITPGFGSLITELQKIPQETLASLNCPLKKEINQKLHSKNIILSIIYIFFLIAI